MSWFARGKRSLASSKVSLRWKESWEILNLVTGAGVGKPTSRQEEEEEEAVIKRIVLAAVSSQYYCPQATEMTRCYECGSPHENFPMSKAACRSTVLSGLFWVGEVGSGQQNGLNSFAV